MLAFLAALFVAPSVFAIPARPSRCGSEPSAAQRAISEQRFAAKRPSTFTEAEGNTGSIKVHWHIISAGNSTGQGDVPQKQITDSIDVLNQAYAPSGLSFDLVNTTRTTNSKWFNDASIGNGAQKEMKETLRAGDEATLNVYTVRLRRYLGYATFPSDYEDDSLDDGVVIRYSTLPGGTEDRFNLGYTLVHEVGHWVGLYHTFQGGCDGQGDQVADTPASESPTSGCPATRDSCPNQPGDDPVHNFMDYSDDECLDNFTPGQITRFKQQLSSFRGVNI